MKILAIGGSNSTNSINRKLANYVAELFKDCSVELYSLSEIDLPLFSLQKEEKEGIHPYSIAFAEKIDKADLIVLSLAENNGSYNAAFKNLMDWTSRIKGRKTWGEKPMFLMATSPGGRGGATVLAGAENYFPHMGALIKATFSLPSFHQNFDELTGIRDKEIKTRLISQIESTEWV